jgi:hypothetical protein
MVLTHTDLKVWRASAMNKGNPWWIEKALAVINSKPSLPR